MIDIYFCIDNDKDYQKIVNGDTKNANITIYDEQSRKGKTSSWKLKNEYAARQVPFILVTENDEFKKVFYKEASRDPISDLFNYLNEL